VEMRWQIQSYIYCVMGLVMGFDGFVLGLHTHKKSYFDVDLWRGF
jgi:hypothetical protein